MEPEIGLFLYVSGFCCSRFVSNWTLAFVNYRFEKVDQLALLKMRKHNNLRRQMKWNQSTLQSKQSPQAENRQIATDWFIIRIKLFFPTRCFFSLKVAISYSVMKSKSPAKKKTLTHIWSNWGQISTYSSIHRQFPINISSNLIYSLAKNN